jgi:hypothetical protein
MKRRETIIDATGCRGSGVTRTGHLSIERGGEKREEREERDRETKERDRDWL